MEESSWIALVSIVASVIIAVASLWSSYKSRSQPHRELLYEKQIEAYSEIGTALDSLLTALGSCLLRADSFLPSKNLVTRLYSEFHKVIYKSEILLPKDVLEELVHLYGTLHPYMRELEDESKRWTEEDIEKIQQAHVDFVNAMRKAAGTVSLSKEILRVVGAKGS